MNHRKELFQSWAVSYEHAIEECQREDLFPFKGYDQLLDAIVELSRPFAGARVLDIGTGAGSLLARFRKFDCDLWGIDFSDQMLAVAHRHLGGKARLIATDLTSELPPELEGGFDICVSSYVFHEFDDRTKLALIHQFLDRLNPNGQLLVGDISFRDRATHDRAREAWAGRWDHSEHYWCAAEILEACEEAGISVRYRQVSECAGVYSFAIP